MRRVRCGSGNELVRATWKPLRHICGDYRRDSSVIIGAVLYVSMTSLSSWAFAFYLDPANRINVSSMKSHGVLGMTQ